MCLRDCLAECATYPYHVCAAVELVVVAPLQRLPDEAEHAPVARLEVLWDGDDGPRPRPVRLLAEVVPGQLGRGVRGQPRGGFFITQAAMDMAAQIE